MIKWFFIIFLLATSYQIVSETSSNAFNFYARKQVFIPDSVLFKEDSIVLKPGPTPYFTRINQLNKERRALKNRFHSQEIDIQKVQPEFERYLVQEIIPYWYGTKWDFDGYTNRPRQGKIACGYFVSTTLLHAGLPIDRYKLAQKSPLDEANMLAYGQKVLTINEFDSLMLYMSDTATKNGIYFIGLDQSHVGFLVKRKHVWFIHSAYKEPAEVRVENALHSEILRAYSRFFLVGLSTNEKFLLDWLKSP
jgi:hypothetical protein